MDSVHILNGNEKTYLKLFLLPNGQEKQKRPLVLICPGGGYLNCSDNEGKPVAVKFNTFGFHAAVLFYSTQFSNPGGSYRDALNDLAEAVSWIHENAETSGIDPDKIFLMGFSAGAHLSAMYGNTFTEGNFGNTYESGNLRIAGCILGYGLLDTEMFDVDTALMIANEEAADMNQITGEQSFIKFKQFRDLCYTAMYSTTKPEKDMLKAASPLEHIHSSSAPCFIWTTYQDDLVNPMQSIQYAERLYKNHVPCELHLFPYGRHGWSLFDETTGNSEKEINIHTARWAFLAAEWMRTRN